MSFSDASEVKRRFFDAASHGRLKVTAELSLKFSNDVKVLSKALIRSCVENHLDVVKWLGEHSAADVNYNNNEWWQEDYTPLIAACSKDHLDIVKYLIETCHADVNLIDRYGYTSLIKACGNVSISVSMYLLCEVSDLNVNIADNDGNTALHYVVWCSKDNYTQLHKACDRGNVTEVRRLVFVQGHKVNLHDNIGYTPLHWACYYGHSDIVETLMLAGADETITNNKGQTPAQVAERYGHRELSKLLNRDSLWQVMLRCLNKSKLSLVVLMMLTVKLMKQRQKQRQRQMAER